MTSYHLNQGVPLLKISSSYHLRILRSYEEVGEVLYNPFPYLSGYYKDLYKKTLFLQDSLLSACTCVLALSFSRVILFKWNLILCNSKITESCKLSKAVAIICSRRGVLYDKNHLGTL